MDERNGNGRVGRIAFSPTPELQAEVARLVSIGRQRGEIADAIGVSLPTLRKYFGPELNPAPASGQPELFAIPPTAATAPAPSRPAYTPPPRRPSEPRGGRKPYVPNELHRRDVIGMLGAGAKIEAVAELLGVTVPTLRKHYATEVEKATSIAKAKVLGKLYTSAMGGNVAAQRQYYDIACKAELAALTEGFSAKRADQPSAVSQTAARPADPALGKKDQAKADAEAALSSGGFAGLIGGSGRSLQ